MAVIISIVRQMLGTKEPSLRRSRMLGKPDSPERGRLAKCVTGRLLVLASLLTVAATVPALAPDNQ